MLNSGMATGNHIMYALGRSDNAYNMGQFYYYFDSAGSTNNRISVGLHSVDDLLNIVGTNRVGIGTTGPSYKLDITGDLRSTTSAYFATSSGNVGIGTTSTAARLVVSDTANFSNTIFNARSDGGYLIFQEAGTTRAYFQWGLTITGSSNGNYLLLSNDESGGSIALQTRTSGGTYNSNALVVDSSSNVGIGITSPSYKLDVSGTGRFSDLLYVNGPGGTTRADTHGISFFNGGVDYRIAFDSVNGTRGYLRYNVDTAGSVWGHIFSGGDFNATPTDIMIVRTDGRVGIGTTTPSSNLVVDGSSTQNTGMAVFDNNHSAGGIMYPAIMAINERGNHSFGVVAEFRIANTTDGDRPAILFSKGGTGNNWALGMGVYSGSNDNFAVGYRSSYYQDAWATSYFTITTSGNIGMGTNAPGAKLEVAGQVRSYAATGEVYAYSTTAANWATVYAGWTSGTGMMMRYHPNSAEGYIENNYPITGGTVYGDINFRQNNGGTMVTRMLIKADGGNVGINTTSPSMKLHVADVGANISSGNAVSTSTMKGVLVQNTNNGNESVGVWFNTGGSHWSGISAQRNDSASTWGTDLRFYTHENGFTDLTFARQRMVITSEGAMGLGVTPSNTGGRFEASNDIIAYSSSDIRFKENVTQIDNSLERILKIRGVYFDWIEMEKFHGNKGRDVGVIAQEVEEILPEIVTTRESGYKAVKYERLIPLLIESIKDLNKKVEDQERENNSLKSLIGSLLSKGIK